MQRKRWFKLSQRAILIGAAVFVTLFVAVAGINLTSLPHTLVENAVAPLRNSGGMNVSFDRARFSGLGSLDLHDVVIDGGTNFEVRVSRLKLRVSSLKWLVGEISDGPITVSLGEGSVSWGTGDGRSTVVFDQGNGVIRGDNNGYVLQDAWVDAAGGTVRAEGHMVDGALDLVVTAHNLELPRELPLFQNIGMHGQARFEGRLEGPWSGPELVGNLAISNGSVWFTPVQQATGHIRLAPGTFIFQNAHLESVLTDAGRKYVAAYNVEGEVNIQSVPTHIAIGIEAINGRIEQVLNAFHLDPIATGVINGLIDVDGVVGDLSVSGNVKGHDVTVFDQSQLNAVEGSFSWAKDNLQIGEAVLTSDGGRLTADGGIFDDVLDISVSMTDWVIDDSVTELFGIPPMVKGVLSFSGHAGGSINDPRLTGHVTGGSLQAGGLTADMLRGPLTLTKDRISVDDVSLRSVGEGTYRVTGAVRLGLDQQPELDLSISVEEASLSAILAASGLDLPARIIDGSVNGHITVEGDPAIPDARFHLVLGDTNTSQDALTLDFSVDKGRLQLGTLPLFLGRDGFDLGGLIGSGLDQLRSILGG